MLLGGGVNAIHQTHLHTKNNTYDDSRAHEQHSHKIINLQSAMYNRSGASNRFSFFICNKNIKNIYKEKLVL